MSFFPSPLVISPPPALSLCSTPLLMPPCLDFPFHCFVTFLVLLPDFLFSPLQPSPHFPLQSSVLSPAVGPGLESLMFASSFCYGFWIQHIWIPGPRCVVATATSVPLVNMCAHPPQSRKQNSCVTFFCHEIEMSLPPPFSPHPCLQAKEVLRVQTFLWLSCPFSSVQAP